MKRRHLVGAAPRRRPGSVLFVLILFGLTMGMLGHVAVQAQKNEVALRLEQERTLRERLVAQKRHLEVEIGRLRSPRRLMDVARAQLGMTPQFGEIRVIRVDPHRVPDDSPAAEARP